MLNRNSHRSAFTLTEMVIVLGIISILTAIGGQVYFKERDRFEFNNALTKTMEMIKTARTYAVSSTPVGSSNTIAENGYGVQFSNENPPLKLTILAKLNSGDEILEAYTLPKQTSFQNFYFNGTQKDSTVKKALILFKPPMGDMVILDNSNNPLNELSVGLSNPAAEGTNPKSCQKITINSVKAFPELTYEPCVP